MVTPHIVCELERSLDELPGFFSQIQSDDCILCLRRFATNNTLLFDAHAASQTSSEDGLTIPGEKSSMLRKYHLNGVPAFKLQGQPFFLGVCHAISETWRRMETMMNYVRVRAYVHYFYKMEAQPRALPHPGRVAAHAAAAPARCEAIQFFKVPCDQSEGIRESLVMLLLLHLLINSILYHVLLYTTFYF